MKIRALEVTVCDLKPAPLPPGEQYGASCCAAARTYARRGLIPGAKAGRRWVFLEPDLAAFILGEKRTLAAAEAWGPARAHLAERTVRWLREQAYKATIEMTKRSCVGSIAIWPIGNSRVSIGH